ncbi:MAG TPA: hypothetical protein VG693_09990, partial [Actinomycetes bacterium]|nr:hypothetical protein [Actinomycetes bacterium]
MRIGRLPRLHFLLRLGFVPRLGFVLLVGAVVAACAGAPNNPGPAPGPPVGEATSSSGTEARSSPHPRQGSPATTTVPWRVGARPLPLRADGFGQVRPTPAP